LPRLLTVEAGAAKVVVATVARLEGSTTGLHVVVDAVSEMSIFLLGGRSIMVGGLGRISK